MRALIDTNVFISYLLSAGGESGAVNQILTRFLAGEFTLLLPDALLAEIVDTVRRKPRLAVRIAPDDLEAFTAILETFGETIPRIQQPIPPVTRDPKDDYLLAYAFVGQADYLVSGDRDLLVLRDVIADVSIVTPREFAELLAAG